MIPLRDTIPSRTVPFVNTLLIFGNVAAFIGQLMQGRHLDAFLAHYAFVPARFFHPSLWSGPAGAGVLTVITSMFLHGGLLHLGGNMLYLWIFGDNVEDALGHLRYLIFYLATGVAAALAHGLIDSTSAIPTVGASGAIAGVLGAYFVLYPHARVVTLVPLFILFPLIEVPAVLYLLGWFLMQFWYGSAALVSPGRGAAAGGGVAWWAHVGGFVAGLALVFLMRPRRRPAASVRLRS